MQLVKTRLHLACVIFYDVESEERKKETISSLSIKIILMKGSSAASALLHIR